jgi:hypothetical protein
MNERGINSLTEFLLFYAFGGLIIGALWAALEADVLLGNASKSTEARARRRRITRRLAPLGVLHVGFALLAMHASGVDPEGSDDEPVARRRAAREARVFLALGVVAVALLAGMAPWG